MDISESIHLIKDMFIYFDKKNNIKNHLHDDNERREAIEEHINKLFDLKSTQNLINLPNAWCTNCFNVSKKESSIEKYSFVPDFNNYGSWTYDLDEKYVCTDCYFELFSDFINDYENQLH